MYTYMTLYYLRLTDQICAPLHQVMSHLTDSCLLCWGDNLLLGNLYLFLSHLLLCPPQRPAVNRFLTGHSVHMITPVCAF